MYPGPQVSWQRVRQGSPTKRLFHSHLNSFISLFLKWENKPVGFRFLSILIIPATQRFQVFTSTREPFHLFNKHLGHYPGYSFGRNTFKAKISRRRPVHSVVQCGCYTSVWMSHKLRAKILSPLNEVKPCTLFISCIEWTQASPWPWWMLKGSTS